MMTIENNKFLFYINAGLILSGYDQYDHEDTEIAALANRIRDADYPIEFKPWFARARTGQVRVAPYWPRMAMLMSACFFIDGEYAFAADSFFCFIESVGKPDPIGIDDLRRWISELPNVLQQIDALPFSAELWDEYSRIVAARMPDWNEQIHKSVKAFFGSEAPQLAFNPNLFASPYSADFVRVDGRIITIAASPDAEAVLHETLHTLIAQHRAQITDFAERYGLGAFADKTKMLEFGYMQNESTASIVDVIEECFVRALSVELSGGGDERLLSHAEFG